MTELSFLCEQTLSFEFKGIQIENRDFNYSIIVKFNNLYIQNIFVVNFSKKCTHVSFLKQRENPSVHMA